MAAVLSLVVIGRRPGAMRITCGGGPAADRRTLKTWPLFVATTTRSSTSTAGRSLAARIDVGYSVDVTAALSLTRFRTRIVPSDEGSSRRFHHRAALPALTD